MEWYCYLGECYRGDVVGNEESGKAASDKEPFDGVNKEGVVFVN